MKSRRWGKRIVVLTAVFSLVLTTLSPLILTRTAYAAGQSNILQNGQIEATLSARFLHACLDSWGSYEAVNGKDIIDFKWSTSTGTERTRALLNGDGSAGLTINNSGGVALYETRYTFTGDGNGYYENNIPGCNATTIKGAFSKLTTDNGGGILCKMGFMQSQYKDGNYGCLPSNATWYYSGNDSFPAGAFDQISKNINDFPAAAKNNITLSYKGKEAINNYAAAKKGTLNDEALWYAYDLYGQTSANAAQGSVLSATQSSSYTEPITIWTYDASRNMHYTETWYAKTGQSGAVGLQKLKDNGGKPSAAAQAFFNAVGSKTMEETITALCNAKYKPENKKGTELRDACVKGAQNQSNAEYCPTTYAEKTSDNSASELQTACKDGQGLDVGNDDTTNPSPDDTADQNTCYTADTQGFGWLVCPGLTWMTAAIDGIITLITSGLQWSMLADGNGAVTIKAVWNSMLGIANIAFAIVFMIIIYSTATSTGISNYGIKKIFPRLVVAAVGVNLSFYLCAALADLSNIAGVGLNNLILNQMTGIDMSGAGMFARLFDGLTQLGAMLLIALLAWSAVLIGLVTILFSIALRSVVLTMLVIVSPLAIVAMMLPNTEKWFKKWRDTFIQLLIVYPAFMAAWAACRLVSNIVAQTQGIGWLLSALCTIAPLAIILPLFKSTSGLMGKMVGMTEKGVGVLGGNALKNLNKKSNAYLRDRAATGYKNRVAGNAAAAHSDMQEKEKQLAELETEKASSWTNAEQARLNGLQTRIARGETLSAEDQQAESDLSAKQAAFSAGTVRGWDDDRDEAKLRSARTEAGTARRVYGRRSAVRNAAFLASNMRFSKANREAETKKVEQGELARRLSEDTAFRQRYAGANSSVSQAEQASRMQRALNQASAIGNKASSEERSDFASLLGDASTLGDSKKGTFDQAVDFRNDMAKNLVTDKDYKVTVSMNGVERELSWATMTDNERLVVFQQAAGGSTPEVAAIRNALATGKIFDDPALQKAAASMVIQSGNKDFLVQGALNADLGSGTTSDSFGQQLITITKNPLEAGTMDRYAKAAFWGDAVSGLSEVQALAAGGDTDATNSLNNLTSAIREQFKQPGAARYVAAVGAEYREILRANNISDADINTLFASTGADADTVNAAMTRPPAPPNPVNV